MVGLRATDAVRLPVVDPGVTLEASLGGHMMQYVWTVNGKAYPDHTPLTVHRDQRVRLVYTNPTMMFHPMHLHGHTFAVARSDGSGPRKDTVIVLPGRPSPPTSTRPTLASGLRTATMTITLPPVWRRFSPM